MQKLSQSSQGEAYSNIRQNDMVWPPHGLAMLGHIAKPCNQHFEKSEDDVLKGLVYSVVAEPSTLRPVRAWVISIEQWSYADVTQIAVTDIITLRVLNNPLWKDNVYFHDIVSDIQIYGKKLSVTPHCAFNAIMAAAVIMTKIDAKRMPDIEKIIGSYQLI